MTIPPGTQPAEIVRASVAAVSVAVASTCEQGESRPRAAAEIARMIFGSDPLAAEALDALLQVRAYGDDFVDQNFRGAGQGQAADAVDYHQGEAR